MSATRRSVSASRTRAGDRRSRIASRSVDSTILIYEPRTTNHEPPPSTTHHLDHDLVQRVFDDPLAPGRLQLRDQVAHRPLLDDRVHRHPVFVAERRDG